MKRPTITKLQSINALIEIKRRDHVEQLATFQERLNRAEYDLLAELKRTIMDPARVATLVELNADHDEEKKNPPLELALDGSITLNAMFLPEVRHLYLQRQAVRKTHPGQFNENDVRAMLEDKLTGCDPESLLSVPENVATIRALLNGLQLLPESYEALST